MNSIEGEKIVFCPSFELEKKTRAFNKYIGFFVSLISLFAVGVGIGALFYAFLSSFLNLVYDHLTVFIFVPVIAFIALAYQLYQFLAALLCSYEFSDGKIIKGRIMNADKVKKKNVAFDFTVIANMIPNIGNSQKAMASRAASDYNMIFNLIALNMDYEFVKQYFDTELYKKKEYINPKLIKETKYSLVYSCDNKHRLVIPKIYDGMCAVDNSKESSFLGRVLIFSAAVFAAALVTASVDLSVCYYKNTHEYIIDISDTEKVIEQQLNGYGYTMKKNSESMYTFYKSMGERDSEIKYYFDKEGNIKNVEVQLYYNSGSENVENELRAIIETLDDDFDSEDIDDFINLVKDNLEGNYQFGKLTSEKYSLRIDRSGGYVDIH